MIFWICLGFVSLFVFLLWILLRQSSYLSRSEEMENQKTMSYH
ncbi:hypothetical protein [Streptococcus agalactiae]|nr:hypothetical protein [Streptococcus agalactiae]